MKKFRLNNWIMLSALFGVLTFASCSEDEDDEVETAPEGWTLAQKSAFITDCMTPDPTDPEDEGGTEELCSCYFDKVSESYTFDEVENADLETGLTIAFLAFECI